MLQNKTLINEPNVITKSQAIVHVGNTCHKELSIHTNIVVQFDEFLNVQTDLLMEYTSKGVIVIIKCNGEDENSLFENPAKNIYHIEDSFIANINNADNPDILYLVAVAIANEIGSAIRNNVILNVIDAKKHKTPLISLSSLFYAFYYESKKTVSNAEMIKYGEETGNYAKLTKMCCIDTEREIYEYAATLCKGSFAGKFQLQMLLISKTKEGDTPESCLLLSFIDTESEGMNVSINADITTEAFNKLCEGVSKNIMCDARVVEMIMNQHMKLFASDLAAAGITDMEQFYETDFSLKRLDQYFKESVIFVKKNCQELTTCVS